MSSCRERFHLFGKLRSVSPISIERAATWQRDLKCRDADTWHGQIRFLIFSISVWSVIHRYCRMIEMNASFPLRAATRFRRLRCMRSTFCCFRHARDVTMFFRMPCIDQHVAILRIFCICMQSKSIFAQLSSETCVANKQILCLHRCCIISPLSLSANVPLPAFPWRPGLALKSLISIVYVD